ncbi:MAG: YkgJ family cysteine cluster protein [Bacteroidota bacterium]
MEYQEDLDRAVAQRKSNKRFFQRLRKSKEKALDASFRDLHYTVFQEIDCLSCANCCKTTSPIFRDIDIQRLSKRLRIAPAEFVERYLQLDNENDYVLKSSPCTFLQDDNKCSVYEDRPLACREYPHTDRKKMHQILTLTRKNTEICPAVSRIVEQLKKVY